MPVHGLLARAASTVVTGAVGAVAYDLVRKAAAKAPPPRDAAVVVTSWGLRGTRRAEAGAESARLAVADVVAEARERIGEEAVPPATGDSGHTHEH